MRIILFCLLVAAAHLPAARALDTTAPDSTRLAEIQTLLDLLGMGFSRTEMEATMLQRVRAGLASQDSTALKASQSYLPDLVKAAFDQHESEVRALQNGVALQVAQRFTRREIQELTRQFSSEPVQRLLTGLQADSPRVRQEGGALFGKVGRDVQILLRAKLMPSRPAGTGVPPLLAAPPSSTLRVEPKP